MSTQNETKLKLDAIVNNLTQAEKDFLNNFGRGEVLRKFMKTPEIKQCNLLVKKDVMGKGFEPGSNNVVYYVEPFVWSRI